MIDLIEKLIERGKQNPKRIVFPEVFDERTLKAILKIKSLGFAKPILIGEEQAINEYAKKLNIALPELTYISLNDTDLIEKYSTEYMNIRNVSKNIALQAMKKPLYFGGIMVKANDADGMVAGAVSITAAVIKAALLTVGLKEGYTRPSSVIIVVIPTFMGEKNKVFVFADSAVNISPTPEELAEIGVKTGQNVKTFLGIEPKIAFLSFSTKGSANHPLVDKVAEATRLAQKLAPDLEIDGELQLDAAIIPEIAKRKNANSSVAGNANVLIFPDLNTGNIGYKLVQYMGHAKAFGPLIQGFNKPINDMSRGATIDDIIGVTAFTVVQSQISL